MKFFVGAAEGCEPVAAFAAFGSSYNSIRARSALLLIWLLILGAPSNHAGRNSILIRWATGMDAGLAALGQGWPFAAARRINVGLRACRA
jgi:hypothetical protein